MTRLDGILVVDKPGGMTSAAVVAKVKRRLGVKRVGHTGTLDPMATGVLPLCLGEGTKVAGYLLAADKAYEAELALGVETDTLDAEGQVTRERPEAAATVDEQQLAAAMHRFVGDGTQIPPMFSAIKHKGKRLYALAREGKEVERAPRAIRIDHFELLAFDAPRARVRVACSKGTYIRSLVADLGESLGCGAHLTALRRTQAGQFHIDQAISLEALSVDTATARLVDPGEAIAHLPGITTPESAVAAVGHGKRLPWSAVSGARAGIPDGLFRLLAPKGGLLALAVVEEGRLRYQRVFTYALT